MTLSPTEREAVVQGVVDGILADIRKEGVERFQLFPLSLVTQFTGLSKPTIRKRLPLVEISPGSIRVRASDLNEYIEKNTR